MSHREANVRDGYHESKRHKQPREMREIQQKPFLQEKGFLPYILKKRNIHTKNPFQVILPSFQETIKPPTVLDGYKILSLMGRDQPDEIFKANLTSKYFNSIKNIEGKGK